MAFALLPRAAHSARYPPQPAPQQQLKQLSLAQLGDIEVTTVSKEPEEVWQTAAAIAVLTQDDIRESGATSIPELLRLIPGVNVAREQSDQWAVAVRGFNSQFSKGLLVLIDGRSVYTPLFEGVYWDVQDLVLADIDRIEVIRGPGGTIWGANAVNGVINIITKKARETQGGLACAARQSVRESACVSRAFFVMMLITPLTALAPQKGAAGAADHFDAPMSGGHEILKSQ